MVSLIGSWPQVQALCPNNQFLGRIQQPKAFFTVTIKHYRHSGGETETIPECCDSVMSSYDIQSEMRIPSLSRIINTFMDNTLPLMYPDTCKCDNI